MRLASPDDARGLYSLIVVSPHFDDAALSLGGTILREARRGGRALVVDVCTARPPTSGLSAFALYQHEQWGAAQPWLAREAEEEEAMTLLGADHLWLGLPDAIYRGELYASEEALFGQISPSDPALEPLVAALRRIAESQPAATVFAPLGVGGHVDHRLALRAALDLTAHGTPVRLYEDAPYCLRPGATDAALAALGVTLVPDHSPIDEDELLGKIAAVLTYASQARWVFREYGEPAERLRALATARAPAPGELAEGIWRPAKAGTS